MIELGHKKAFVQVFLGIAVGSVGTRFLIPVGEAPACPLVSACTCILLLLSAC